jgi:LysM repeat protein
VLIYEDDRKACWFIGIRMSEKKKTRSYIVFLTLVSALLVFPKGTFAGSETPYDLIDTVNSLRASYGLEPYQIDPCLMAYAQAHSEYQAEMQSSTHLHSDGTLPWEIGLQENVAGGDEGIVTVSIVVYEIWVDWGHRHVLTGYVSGEIGAGMALADNGQIYYTVDIRPAEGAPTVVPEQGTPVPFIPYATSTPDADGSINHMVRDGQTLWSIAISYGVTVNDLRRLNGIAGDSTTIYVGQKLLIRPASAITPAPLEAITAATTQPMGEPSSVAIQTFTVTTIPFTETKAPTKTVIPSQSMTVVPTSIATEQSLKNKSMGPVILLTIAVIGFVLVLIFGFIRLPDDKGSDNHK